MKKGMWRTGRRERRKKRRKRRMKTGSQRKRRVHRRRKKEIVKWRSSKKNGRTRTSTNENDLKKVQILKK